MTETAPRVAIALLGVPSIVVDGHEIPVPGALPRALVAYLALHAGHAFSPDELIPVLWVDPPRAANASLRSHASRLRTGPLAGVLGGGRRGYRLDLDPEDVDALRFARLVTAGLAGSGIADAVPRDGAIPRFVADTSLDEARELWRDEPLRGVLAPFAAAERERLGALRLRLLAALAERRIEAGAGDAVPAAAELASAAPADGAAAALHATALSRAGRTAEALDALDRAARALAERGASDPALDRLRQAIVRHEPHVSARPARAEVVRHGVPVPLTPLVGRSRELDLVREARARSRLVTIAGPGGVGKTRLAIEAARRGGAGVDEEQWMLDLAVLAEPGEIPAALAGLVGSREPTVDSALRVLDDRPGLLVLDNAEHLLAAVRSLVTCVLSACAGVTVLVTSREPLDVPGESVARIPPLTGEAHADAVRIFAERAREADPALDLAAVDPRRLDELVRALDGLPLALEIAAGRLASMGFDELHDAIASHGVLAAAEGSARSLARTIGGSLERLDADERGLLRELGRFAGLFDATAVSGICRPGGAAPASELLPRLVARSLVHREGDAAPPSYRLLEAVKELVRREDAPDAAWTERHAEWLGELVARTAPLLHTSDEPLARARLDAFRADLAAALDTAERLGRRELALRLAGGQGWHWFRRGALVFGRRELERALAVGEPGGGGAEARAEARARMYLGVLCFTLADPRAAREHLERGAAAADAASELSIAATIAGFRSYVAAAMGDLDDVRRQASAAHRLAADAEPWARALVGFTRGQAERALARPASALDALAEAARIADVGGEAWVAILARHVTAKILIEQRRGADAIPVVLPQIAQSVRQHDPTTTVGGLVIAAGAAAAVERHELGAVLLGAVDRLGRRYGYDPMASEPGEFAAYRERIRAALSPRAYRAAYERGLALALRDAVAAAEALAR